MIDNNLAKVFPKMDEFIFNEASSRLIYLFLKNIWNEFFVNHPNDVAYYDYPSSYGSEGCTKIYVNTTNGIAMRFKIIQFYSNNLIATVPSLEEFYIYKPEFEKTQIKPDGYHRCLIFDTETQEFSVDYSVDSRFNRNKGYIIEGIADHRFSMDPKISERSFLYFNIVFKKINKDGSYSWSSRTSKRMPFYHIISILTQIKALIIDDIGLIPYLNSKIANSMHYNGI